MYINYEKIGNILGIGKNFFYNLKIKQNLKYIKNNQKQVIKKLKNKSRLNVIFYVYDETKWKSQSVYDLMANNNHFNPLIVVTKNCAIEGNANFQTINDIKKCYDFFRKKGMNVTYGYDFQKDDFIPFEVFKPDIVIYSHPWYVHKTQGPVMCSKFALTFYIPYFIPASKQWHEYGLRFHKYIYRHYVPTKPIKEFYAGNMSENAESLKVVGHPILDFYYLNKEKKEPKYIIYSPHWTVCGNNLRFGTFDWSGNKVLELAEAHPELNWVFRPHPLLYKFIISSYFMTKEEIDKYFERWKNIAIYSDSGDYTELFLSSYAMITDCGSFLTEYFVSEKPVIHLVSDKFMPNQVVKAIDKTYYLAHNIEELKEHFDNIILNKNDYKKADRIELLEKLNLKNSYSAKDIVNDILRVTGLEDEHKK